MPSKVPITPQQSKHAQRRLIDAIYDLHGDGKYCEILDSLRADVVPLWLARTFPSHQQESRYRIKFSSLPRERAMKALQQWAIRFNLTRRENEPTDWILDWGMTICQVHVGSRQTPYGIVAPDFLQVTPAMRPVQPALSPTLAIPSTKVPAATAGKLETSPPPALPPLPNVLPLSRIDLSVNALGPLANEGWGEFKERLLPGIKDKLRAIYQESKAMQVPKPKPKDTYRKKRQFAHYRWFVLYQCAGKSYPDIAEGYKSGDDTTIRKGVHRVAREVGITLRGN